MRHKDLSGQSRTWMPPPSVLGQILYRGAADDSETILLIREVNIQYGTRD